jgi:hypothetical protein
MASVGEAAHAVVREAKEAGVFVLAGGLVEDEAPALVAVDGTVTAGTYPETQELSGGVAAECRCAQEVRSFGYGPLV